jgi:hypothetical protein
MYNYFTVISNLIGRKETLYKYYSTVAEALVP